MAILIFEHDDLDPSSRLGETLRDHGHRCRPLRLDQGDTLPVDYDDIEGLVVMGGSMNVDQTDQHPWLEDELAFIKETHDRKLPVVGVCLGAQLIAQALGGTIGPMDNNQIEVGWYETKLAFPGTVDTILAGTPWQSMQFHTHGYEIKELPAGGTPLSGSKLCRTQAYNVGMTTYGFQYHFEWKKSDIERVLSNEANLKWFADHSVDPDGIRELIPEHYPMYRHLGDRICKRLADLVFPIDKRLTHQSGPPNSFEAQYS